MRKFLSLVLACTMLMAMSVTAFATERNDNAPVLLEENCARRVAKSEDADFIYVAIYDRNNETVQLIQTDKKTGEKIAGEAVVIRAFSEENGAVNSRAGEYLEEKTFTNYEYKKTYGLPNRWELRRPGDIAFLTKESFETYETTSNKEFIDAFEAAVNSINVKEGEIVSALGMAALSYLAGGAAGAGAIFTGGTMTPAAWAALLAAGGFSQNYINVVMEYDSLCKAAYDSYMETYTHSQIL